MSRRLMSGLALLLACAFNWPYQASANESFPGK